MASYPPPPPPPPPPPGFGGPPPGYGPPPGQYGGYQPIRTTNSKAIAALVCGLCAFVVCPLIGIAAVILGPQAKREIAADPGRYDGTGMAQAGQILGWISMGLLALGIVGIIVAIALGAASSNSSSFESLAALVS